MVKAVLKKPLDGKPEGSIVEFNKTDFEMLQGLGAVGPAPEDEPEKEPEPAPTPTPAPAKAAAVPENKMATDPANKSADAASKNA